MSNALARMIGQFEVSLADMARRAVESVAEPIKQKSKEITDETIGAATRTVKSIVVKLILGIVAGAMAVVAIVYAVVALYEALLPRLGPVESHLVIAGLFAAIAVLAIVAIVFWPAGAAPAKSPADKVDEARKALDKADKATATASTAVERQARLLAEAATTADSHAEPLREAKVGLETMISVLGAAGFRKEQAGLRAGLALANQLKPMQIVALALIGGFVAGLRYPPRRR